jgi:hypothetical protein
MDGGESSLVAPGAEGASNAGSTAISLSMDERFEGNCLRVQRTLPLSFEHPSDLNGWSTVRRGERIPNAH